MASVWITGDIHGDPTRLGSKFWKRFPLTDGKDDNFVIITGDFGLVWAYPCESRQENNWLNWLESKNFTTLWCDGNHENFDRIYSSEYPVEEWHGGKVQFIRPHVIHLMRGEIYDILDAKFFVFGGAQSHDIRDGILDPEKDKEKIKDWNKRWNVSFRVNHRSWWKEEQPSEAEMQNGLANLDKAGNKVDFIISHGCPQQVASMMGYFETDPISAYFNTIAETVQFDDWYFGHYHRNETIMCKFHCLYDNIIRIL